MDWKDISPIPTPGPAMTHLLLAVLCAMPTPTPTPGCTHGWLRQDGTFKPGVWGTSGDVPFTNCTPTRTCTMTPVGWMRPDQRTATVSTHKWEAGMRAKGWRQRKDGAWYEWVPSATPTPTEGPYERGFKDGAEARATQEAGSWIDLTLPLLGLLWFLR